MIEATGLKEYFSELLVEYKKVKDDCEVEMDALKAKLSIKDDIKNTSKGNRYAVQNDEYIEKTKEFNLCRRICGSLEVKVDKLKDIAFQCYNIWQSGHRGK